MTVTLPPELIVLARSQNGALTGTQVRGLSGDRGLARLVRAGRLVRLWRNAYAVPPIVGPAANLEAARLTLGQPVTACLHTAAALHGFDISSDRDTHILAAHDWSNELPGLVRHRSSAARPPVLVDGFRVVSAAETAVRVACLQNDPAKVLAVLDAALARSGMPPDDLADVAGELRIRGIKLVRELVPHADGRAESPGESWLRWVCIEAALPAPTPQLWVTTGAGGRYRLDLGWAEFRAGCEYDGVEFHTGDALTKDRARYNALARAGWQMQAVTHRMIWRDRRALVADIRSMING
jgi:hypothetical protein